jgi:hypothetical protein
MAMGGFVSGAQFGTRVGLRVAIFTGLTVGFPFIVYGLVLATNARSVGGASGALAVMAGIFLKPVIILGFLLSLIGPCWSRMRSLGLPAFWGLLVPLLFLMDGMFLLVVGAHWGVGFSLGILYVNAPLFAMTALAMLLAMGVASPPSDDIGSSETFRRLGWICAILAIMLIVIALMTSGAHWWVIAVITFKSQGSQPVPLFLPFRLGHWAAVLKPAVCIAFCMAIAAMALMSRRQGSGDRPGGSVTTATPETPAPSGVVFGRR